MNYYETIFAKYKSYIETNSIYGTKVVKYNTNTSSYFPLVSLVLNNDIDTDYCTYDKIEYFNSLTFAIDIYAKEKTMNGVKVPSQVIINELRELTIKFFKKLNMKKTLDKPTPNLDTSILRQTMNYQCMAGSRGLIIRR